jgi:tRNA (guanine-N7-)-methyltransferase
MHANSRPVSSNQISMHDQLGELVTRHAQSHFQKPIADVNRQAFTHAIDAWCAAGKPTLILDAGCGVGLSTWHLAQQNPGSFVVGVDQSADRLARHTAWSGPPPLNCVLVRADLVDFWRLLLEAGIHPARHYLLYPNPWPKKSQLARRWHGHAIFPAIIALGGAVECRSNWKIYIEEFAAALQQLTSQAVVCESYQVAGPADTDPKLPKPMTPFEEKYRASGHALWRCRVQLPTHISGCETPLVS